MGFRIIEGRGRTLWAAVDATDTLYVGQLVYATSDGVAPFGQAAGAADTTNKKVILGVVVGTDNATPVHDTTYNTEKITAVTTQADLNARDYHFRRGVCPVGDPRAMVEIAEITPMTVLYGPIYNSSFGTAPTVLSVTTGSTDGFVSSGVTDACDFTPVADLCTIYCRSGANMGIYRITTDISTTQPRVTHAFPEDIAVGDTFVRVPLREIGDSYVQFDAESLFIDCSASPATNYYVIRVLKLDLSESGKEHAIFRFGLDHFAVARA